MKEVNSSWYAESDSLHKVSIFFGVLWWSALGGIDPGPIKIHVYNKIYILFFGDRISRILIIRWLIEQLLKQLLNIRESVPFAFSISLPHIYIDFYLKMFLVCCAMSINVTASCAIFGHVSACYITSTMYGMLRIFQACYGMLRYKLRYVTAM
jgi:hypothetical protein